MPWETETGMPTEFDMAIVDAQFITDANYTNDMGQPIPVLALYYESRDGREQRQYLSIGSGWEIIDGGERINDPDRPERDVHGSSTLGKWIDRVAELVPDINEHGEPTAASTWVGLKFHIDEEEYEFNGEKRTRPMPQEFLGSTDTAVTPQPEPAEKSEAADNESPFGDRETAGSAERLDSDSELSREDNMRLGRWAGECETFEDFDEKIFQEADKLTDAAQDALMDGDRAREIWEEMS